MIISENLNAIETFSVMVTSDQVLELSVNGKDIKIPNAYLNPGSPLDSLIVPVDSENFVYISADSHGQFTIKANVGFKTNVKIEVETDNQ